MKIWLKKYGIGCLFIVAALLNLYSSARHFQFNRSEFDVIYRWELSGFIFGLIFLVMGVAQLFEARNKKRFSSIFMIVSSSILLVFGLIAMLVFDSDIGFFGDMIMMVGLPIFMIIINVIKLRSGKEIFPKKQLKAIDIALGLIIAVIFIWIILIFSFTGV